MRKILILLVGASLAACSAAPPHILAAHKITKPFIQKSRNQGLDVLGTGGRMMNHVEDISVSFIGYGKYNLEEARRHFLEVVRPFVKEISESQDLRQYLAHPNHPERAAQVSISYIDVDGGRVQKPFIAHVIMVNGKIVYSVSDSPMTLYRTVHEETYQEALQKINCVAN